MAAVAAAGAIDLPVDQSEWRMTVQTAHVHTVPNLGTVCIVDLSVPPFLRPS
jgi:hypothetical protein